jgi:hypothetical protein
MNNMKNQTFSLAVGAAIIAGVMVTPSTYAFDNASLTKELVSVSAQERPAKAADLVAKASSADQQSVAEAAVKVAVTLNPSGASDVVSAVAHENPSVAAFAAVAAATLQPKQLEAITKAAVTGAPSEAAKIVAALIKQFPKSYALIAVAASQASPSSGREILSVVAENVPALQAFLQGAVSGFAANDGNLPVQVILNEAPVAVVASGAPQPVQPGTPISPVLSPTGGSINPNPFQNPVGTPVVDTTSTTESGSGGRTYGH